MSKFTKGEWVYDDFSAIVKPVSKNSRPICIVIEDSENDYSEEEDANGRLIAAAPEMYDELYEVLQLLQGKSSYDGDEYSQHAEDIRELLACIDGKEAEE